MPELEKKEKTDKAEETDLKGTFISVGILGLFIIVSWAGVWYLFISR